jgi:cysteine desulfuration protein SufE
MNAAAGAALPPALATLLEEFVGYGRDERAEMLIDYADRFVEVPAEVARRPFPAEHRAPGCESEAYVWAADRPDGTLQFHFAVENPQGISAKAWCAILLETLSGAPLGEVAQVTPDVIFTLFGRELSMGKGQGLAGVLELVTRAARRRLQASPR